MTYFDNSATTFPKPKRVRQAVQTAFERYGANPGRSGHTLAMNTAMKIYECREEAASLFGGQLEDVIFTSNCSHALNIALKGILRHGDHVIISELEHNSVLRPVHAMASRGMITYSIAQVADGDDELTARAFAALIRPETRLIACTHGSNVLGIRLPIERLGRLAKEYGLLFLVDAAQTAGVLEIDMERCGIDFLCTAGHKSLYGPPGTGMLITPHGSAILPLMEGGSGANSADPYMPETAPERLECGTVNTVGIIGLKAGISFVKEKGIDHIYRHEMKVGREVYYRLRSIPGVVLYTDGFEEGRHLPVIAFNLEGMGSEELTERLSEMGFALRGGLHCAPLAHRRMGTSEQGAARVSIGAFNNTQQARELCNAVARIAKG